MICSTSSFLINSQMTELFFQLLPTHFSLVFSVFLTRFQSNYQYFTFLFFLPRIYSNFCLLSLSLCFFDTFFKIKSVLNHFLFLQHQNAQETAMLLGSRNKRQDSIIDLISDSARDLKHDLLTLPFSHLKHRDSNVSHYRCED